MSDRPYLSVPREQLEELVRDHWGDLATLTEIVSELSYRDSRFSRRFAGEVAVRLCELLTDEVSGPAMFSAVIACVRERYRPLPYNSALLDLATRLSKGIVDVSALAAIAKAAGLYRYEAIGFAKRIAVVAWALAKDPDAVQEAIGKSGSVSKALPILRKVNTDSSRLVHNLD